MLLSYGKGRIFHTIIGHDIAAELCRFHRDVRARHGVGRHWKSDAEGAGKLPVRDAVSVRADIGAMGGAKP